MILKNVFSIVELLETLDADATLFEPDFQDGKECLCGVDEVEMNRRNLSTCIQKNHWLLKCNLSRDLFLQLHDHPQVAYLLQKRFKQLSLLVRQPFDQFIACLLLRLQIVHRYSSRKSNLLTTTLQPRNILTLFDLQLRKEYVE